MKSKIIKNIFLFLIFFFANYSLADHNTQITSPEGRLVTVIDRNEASSGQISDWNDATDYWISYYQLNAIRIDNSSRTYNCHGYAWVKSEERGTFWMDQSEMNQFINDQSWSNDNQSSYISSPEAQATQSKYNAEDHSVRKIQNSYPIGISDGRDYVSKWGSLGLVQHEKNHDVYYLKENLGHDFRKLKTTHYGTFSNYEKTWVGAGGITHAVTGNIECPNKLTIKSGASVNLGNNKYIRCTGNGKIVKQGSITGYTPYAKSGSYYKGFFPSSTTIQQIIDWSSSGWDIYVASGTYTENIYMEPNIDVVGAGVNSTTINGKVYFNTDDDATLSNLKVKNKITVNNSDGVSLSNIKAGHDSCYIDVSNSGMVYFNNFTSDVSRTQAIYAHNNSDLTISQGSLKNKYDGIYLAESNADLLNVELYQNTYDISAVFSTVYAFHCCFSSPVAGSTIYSYNSTVNWDRWRCCGGRGSFAKTTATQSSQPELDQDPAYTAYTEANAHWRQLVEIIREEQKSEERKTFSDYRKAAGPVTDQFKYIITQYPESPFAVFSLYRLSSIWNATDAYQELSSYMIPLTKSADQAHFVPWAKNALSSLYIRQHDYKKALNMTDELLEEYPEHRLAVEWLYRQGILYKYHLGQPALSEKMFNCIITAYPDHPTAQSARDELKDSAYKVMGKDIAVKTGTAAKDALELTVQSAPNPFNPETAIHFTLPEQGKVVLTIYDILGRKVTTLVEGHRSAGTHVARWDGCDASGHAVASGTYIYQLRFKEKVLNRKLMLVW